MRRWKKRSLRNESRKNHKLAPRREIGRTPNWVFQEKRDQEHPEDREEEQ